MALGNKIVDRMYIGAGLLGGGLALNLHLCGLGHLMEWYGVHGLLR